MKRIIFFIGLTIVMATLAAAQNITLPKPQTTGGMPLMDALQKRQSSREFSEKEIPVQLLSNLLWAANGINRQDSKKHTAPSSMNEQPIDIYVSTASGLYLYNPLTNILELILEEDIRAKTGKQDFTATAPLNLVYVSDYAKIKNGADCDKASVSSADAAFIGQNVYLFCASEGLAVVIRAWIDKEPLQAAMHLSPTQKVVLAQTIGYPKVK
jgi:nitroreductase